MSIYSSLTKKTLFIKYHMHFTKVIKQKKQSAIHFTDEL